MINDVNTSLLLSFAQAGFTFFPLVKPWGNKKLGEPKGWPSIATSDAATISSWLETSKYGFGMTFGKREYFAIDLDGKEGIENFKAAMKLYRIPEPSLIFSTPSGGRHLIYKYPEGLSIKNVAGWDVGTGLVNAKTNIDIRADGGYIGSFGARENGYTLLYGLPTDPLVSLPDDVVRMLPVRPSQEALAASALAMTKGMVDMLETTDTRTSLHGVIPSHIAKGTRDATLFNLIGSWVRSGLDKSCVKVLVEEAVRRCEGNTSDIDIDGMIERTFTSPDFVYAKRSKALQLLLKNLVYLSDINKYITLHDKAIMVKAAIDVKFSTLIKAGVKPNGDDRFLPLSAVWHADDSKLVYRDVGYKPGGEIIYYDSTSAHDVVNMYVKPDIKPVQNDELFAKFIEFANVICNDPEKGRILVEFFAHLVQKPAVKIGIAPVVITTKQGIGKNFFLKIITKLLGGKNVTQLYSDNVVNNFNSSMAISQLIVVNESIGDRSSTFNAKAKNAQAMAKLKSMITDYNQPIERKGHDIVTRRTYTNFIFFSNDLGAVTFDGSDRRFLCIINDHPPRDKEFFDSMDVLKTDEGVAAIDFGLRTLQLTKIYENMTHTSKSRDDLDVLASGMTEHEQDVFIDISSNAYIFKSIFTSTQLFSWYCVHKFGLNFQRDRSFISRLRKQFFLPLYVRENYRQAKQINLPTSKFFLSVQGQSDPIELGGKAWDTHSIWYLKPKHHEKPMYGDSLDLSYIQTELKGCISNFIRQVSNIGTPDLTMMKGGLQTKKDSLI